MLRKISTLALVTLALLSVDAQKIKILNTMME